MNARALNLQAVAFGDQWSDEVFFQKGLPGPDGRRGYANAEAFFNLGAGCMYAGENDNPRRSGYLWEIRLT